MQKNLSNKDSDAKDGIGFKRIWVTLSRLTQDRKKFFFMPAVYMGLAAVFEVFAPWCLVRAVDDGIAAGDLVNLTGWLALATLTQIAAGIVRYFGQSGVYQLGLNIEKKRLNYLFRCSLFADIRVLPGLDQGTSMGQIIFAAGSERHFIEALYSQGMPLIIMTIGSFAALMFLSWQLACFSLAICPIAAILWIWMRRKIRPAARNDYDNREMLYRRFLDAFRAIIPIRALHQEKRFITQFEKSSENCVKSGLVLSRRLSVQGPFFDILQAFVMLLVFGIGGWFTMQGEVSIGILLGFQVYLGRLFSVMRSGSGLFGSWQQYLEGSIRAREIEALPRLQDIEFKTAQSPEVLRIEHLSFSFDDHPVWHDESLTICEGEKRAVLLPSGSGKTTLARCILGLYPIESGTIALPDGDSEKVGIVVQENVLFDGSLRDNIALMCENLTDEEYEKLIYLCGLEKVAARVENSSIGEFGSRLSGGEQRRVMLARALANHPKLLIIDQMASELEPSLCHEIFQRIHDDDPKMAFLYFGHRMPEWD